MTALRALSDAVLPLCLLVGVAVLAVKVGGGILAALPPIDLDRLAGGVLFAVIAAHLLTRRPAR